MQLCAGDTVVSINMHSSLREELHGVRLASCGVRRFDDYYVHEADGYHLYGNAIDQNNTDDSDVVLYYQNFITVCPVQVNLTDQAAMRTWQHGVGKLCW